MLYTFPNLKENTFFYLPVFFLTFPVPFLMVLYTTTFALLGIVIKQNIKLNIKKFIR